MDLLKERIRREGKVLPGNIIKVDGFLNHRVDTKLMAGIALATMCAYRYGLPLIYAKKAKSDNIEGGIIKSDIYSYTYKKKVTLMVSAEWLKPTDKVLIIDDFLANGEALRGLCEIVSSAGAELVGMGVAVEKGFQPGGKKLRDAGIPLYSLAIIEKADGNGIVFRDGQEEK